MKNYFFNKNVYVALLSCSISLTALSLLGGISGIKEVALGMLFGIIMFALSIGNRDKFRNDPSGKLFFTKAGYAFAGISVGLIILATTFNIVYEGGWFDFTDFLFVLLGQPLLMLLNFDFNNDRISSRIVLWVLVIVNLSIIIYSIDLLLYGIGKLYKFLIKK